jgi:TRAP-type C4-dicarboxylate transport system permease large subunit
VTSAGSLGLLFAPSLPLILYGFVAGQLGTTPGVSIEDLFIAGILPGLLMILLLGTYAAWHGRDLPARAQVFSWARVTDAAREAAWEIPLPILVHGAIYSGA